MATEHTKVRLIPLDDAAPRPRCSSGLDGSCPHVVEYGIVSYNPDSAADPMTIIPVCRYHLENLMATAPGQQQQQRFRPVTPGH